MSPHCCPELHAWLKPDPCMHALGNANAQGVENKRTFELNEEDINKLRDEVGKYTTESDLVGEHW